MVEVKAVARTPEKSDPRSIQEPERTDLASVGDDRDQDRLADPFDTEARPRPVAEDEARAEQKQRTRAEADQGDTR
jgi:hypothetical protein